MGQVCIVVGVCQRDCSLIMVIIKFHLLVLMKAPTSSDHVNVTNFFFSVLAKMTYLAKLYILHVYLTLSA